MEPLILLLFVVLFSCLAAREIRFLLRARRCTTPADGRITLTYLHRRHRSDPLTIVYTWAGKEYTGRTHSSFTHDRYIPDMPVTVLVDPGDPEHFILPEEKRGARIGIPVYVCVAALLLWVLFDKY